MKDTLTSDTDERYLYRQHCNLMLAPREFAMAIANDSSILDITETRCEPVWPPAVSLELTCVLYFTNYNAASCRHDDRTMPHTQPNPLTKPLQDQPSPGTPRPAITRYSKTSHHQVLQDQPSPGTPRQAITRYSKTSHHQALQDQPSPGTPRPAITRHSKTSHHQVLPDQPSPGTPRPAITRYSTTTPLDSS